MDIVTGLSAATQALGLVKELRQIDATFGDAEFKLKIAELASALADAKLALVDAQAKVRDLEAEIARLTSGDLCPVCRVGRLKVVSVQPHDWSIGTEFHSLECDNSACTYKNQRTYDTDKGVYGRT